MNLLFVDSQSGQGISNLSVQVKAANKPIPQNMTTNFGQINFMSYNFHPDDNLSIQVKDNQFYFAQNLSYPNMLNAFITIKVNPKFQQQTALTINMLDGQLNTPLNDQYITIKNKSTTVFMFAALNGQLKLSNSIVQQFMGVQLNLEVVNSVDYSSSIRYNFTIQQFVTVENIFVQRRKPLVVSIGVFTKNMSIPFANFSVLKDGRQLARLQANQNGKADFKPEKTMNLRVNDTITLAFQSNDLYLDKTTTFLLPDAPSVIGIRLGLKNPLIYTIEFAVAVNGSTQCPAGEANIAFNLVGQATVLGKTINCQKQFIFDSEDYSIKVGDQFQYQVSSLGYKNVFGSGIIANVTTKVNATITRR